MFLHAGFPKQSNFNRIHLLEAHVDLFAFGFCCLVFSDSLLQWKSEGKAAVWLRVPISLSRCAAAASTLGFAFHHAKDDYAILSLWLEEGESRLPGFATHQVGVAGRDGNTLKGK